MRLLIVTGMSGAGKSTVLHSLEDAGWFCADNLPVPLLGTFLTLLREGGSHDRVAVGIDVRSGELPEHIGTALTAARAEGIRCEVLFLDASDESLIKRYKETRRTHPLAGQGRIEDGIRLERARMDTLRTEADYCIDTSNFLVRDLVAETDRLFTENAADAFFVTVLSFGFKYGIPRDADLVFDVRFLPNPYYVEGLRSLTGRDGEIVSFLNGYPETGQFLAKLRDLIRFLIPYYRKEGKRRLVIAMGCTGGRHRSVMCAEALMESLKHDASLRCHIDHRDLMLDPSLKR
ncbi:MAG: RNase adapter RapZ [Lachnospiraceae bacterium]|nr:RNase adapter RapZ [Lachnospiraceae bacterium]